MPGRARRYEHEPRQLNQWVRELRQTNMEAQDLRQKKFFSGRGIGNLGRARLEEQESRQDEPVST